MQVNLSLSPGYRLTISRASRVSELADHILISIAAVGGSAAFLEILRRWLQRRQERRQEQLLPLCPTYLEQSCSCLLAISLVS